MWLVVGRRERFIARVGVLHDGYVEEEKIDFVEVLGCCVKRLPPYVSIFPRKALGLAACGYQIPMCRSLSLSGYYLHASLY